MEIKEKLIKEQELLNASQYNAAGGENAAKLLMRLLGLNKINQIYAKHSNCTAEEFIDSVLEELGIQFEVSNEELERIPKSGAFISISNHPYGGIDGLILIKILSMVRSDYKLMANFLLQRIKPLSDNILAVNPFENKKDAASSIKGIKESLKHLKAGHCIGLFPAGEVSTYKTEPNVITDKKWDASIVKFIRKANVSVVPIYFEGSNSRIFHLLGLIHPTLRTIKLPSELFNKKNKVIKVRIGNPVFAKEQEEFADLAKFGRFLRAKIYSLQTAIEVKPFFKARLGKSKKVKPIAEPVRLQLMLNEIDAIKEKCFLFNNNEYHVYCSPYAQIPNIMQEIGRLREITFREVGEGTNSETDTDEFDLYYHHLFIWDTIRNQIVGAYRAGKGNEIYSTYGRKGFYINSLFKIEKKFSSVLNQSVELGRSFIVQEYQKKPMPLFLLWKGILYFLLKNPEFRYLIGPVSISNQFTNQSKAILVEFIKANHFNKELAALIKPRKAFKVKTKGIDTEILTTAAGTDMQKLDKTIKDIELKSLNIPVLVKKYLKLNGKIIGFNIDPKFNDALDGLLILDLYNVPIETITSLSKELNDHTILNRFAKIVEV
ncbi:MAG TPA: hemolysin [Bacteroidales bacterium]|nr:hemolysin [Bacteroidales bacterium]